MVAVVIKFGNRQIFFAFFEWTINTLKHLTEKLSTIAITLQYHDSFNGTLYMLDTAIILYHFQWNSSPTLTQCVKFVPTK